MIPTSAVPGDLVAGKVPVHVGARHVRDEALVLVAVVVGDQGLVVVIVHDMAPVHELARLKQTSRKK